MGRGGGGRGRSSRSRSSSGSNYRPGNSSRPQSKPSETLHNPSSMRFAAGAAAGAIAGGMIGSAFLGNSNGKEIITTVNEIYHSDDNVTQYCVEDYKNYVNCLNDNIDETTCANNLRAFLNCYEAHKS